MNTWILETFVHIWAQVNRIISDKTEFYLNFLELGYLVHASDTTMGSDLKSVRTIFERPQVSTLFKEWQCRWPEPVDSQKKCIFFVWVQLVKCQSSKNFLFFLNVHQLETSLKLILFQSLNLSMDFEIENLLHTLTHHFQWQWHWVKHSYCSSLNWRENFTAAACTSLSLVYWKIREIAPWSESSLSLETAPQICNKGSTNR